MGVAQDLAGSRAIARVLATCAGLTQLEKRPRAHLDTVCPHEIYAVDMQERAQNFTFPQYLEEKKSTPKWDLLNISVLKWEFPQ